MIVNLVLSNLFHGPIMPPQETHAITEVQLDCN
jgi:hypothetical protein